MKNIDNSRILELAMNNNIRILNALLQDVSLIESDNLSEDIFCNNISISLYKSILNIIKDGSFDKTAKFNIKPEQLYEESCSQSTSITEDLIKSIYNYSDEKTFNINDAIRHAKNSKKVLSATKKIREALEDLETKTYDNDSIISVKDKLEKATSDLHTNDLFDIKKVYTAETWLDSYLDDTKDRRKGKQFPYYNVVLDEMINEGATPGDGIIICSATGMGKTTAVINIMDDFLNHFVPCILFSSEMSKNAMMDRLLSKRLEIPFSEIVNPKSPEDFDSIRSSINSDRDNFISNENFRFCADTCPSIEDIKKAVRQFQSDLGRNYCIVFIDLLSMVKDFQKSTDGANFAQSTELAMNALNAAAKELNIHFIGTVQLGRKDESERIDSWDAIKKTRPSRTAIKNSNAYLERARTTIALWRPYYYAKMYLQKEEYEDRLDIIHFTMLKSNNNDIIERQMIFNPEYFTLIPIDENEQN